VVLHPPLGVESIERARGIEGSDAQIREKRLIVHERGTRKLREVEGARRECMPIAFVHRSAELLARLDAVHFVAPGGRVVVAFAERLGRGVLVVVKVVSSQLVKFHRETTNAPSFSTNSAIDAVLMSKSAPCCGSSPRSRADKMRIM